MSVKVSLFVPDDWSPEKRRQIVGAFREAKATHDERPGMGAGASGLAPELLFYVTAAGALVAAGFLGAVGTDLWRAIKTGIRKVTKIKPDKMSAVPPEMVGKVPLQGVLIWWLKFRDLNLLVIVPLDENAIDAALEALPAAIDQFYARKNGPRFLRLHWEDDDWEDR